MGCLSQSSATHHHRHAGVLMRLLEMNWSRLGPLAATAQLLIAVSFTFDTKLDACFVGF